MCWSRRIFRNIWNKLNKAPVSTGGFDFNERIQWNEVFHFGSCNASIYPTNEIKKEQAKEATTRKWHQHDGYNCIFSELFFLSSSASKCDIVGRKALKTFPHFSHCTQSLATTFQSCLSRCYARRTNTTDLRKHFSLFAISLDDALPILLLFGAVSSGFERENVTRWVCSSVRSTERDSIEDAKMHRFIVYCFKCSVYKTISRFIVSLDLNVWVCFDFFFCFSCLANNGESNLKFWTQKMYKSVKNNATQSFFSSLFVFFLRICLASGWYNWIKKP